MPDRAISEGIVNQNEKKKKKESSAWNAHNHPNHRHPVYRELASARWSTGCPFKLLTISAKRSPSAAIEVSAVPRFHQTQRAPFSVSTYTCTKFSLFLYLLRKTHVVILSISIEIREPQQGRILSNAPSNGFGVALRDEERKASLLRGLVQEAGKTAIVVPDEVVVPPITIDLGGFFCPRQWKKGYTEENLHLQKQCW